MNKPIMITESIATGVLQNHKIKYLLSSFQDHWLEFKARMLEMQYRMTSIVKMNRVLTTIQKAGANATIDTIDSSMLDVEETFMLEKFIANQLTYFVFEGTEIYGLSCVFYKVIDVRVRALVEKHTELDYATFINVPNWSDIVEGFEYIKDCVYVDEEKAILQERIEAFNCKIKFFSGVNKIGEGIADEFDREMASTSKKLKAAKRTMIAHNYEDYFRRQYARQDSMMLEYNLIKNHYTQTNEN